MPQLQRFKWWVILTLTSFIYLASLIEALIIVQRNENENVDLTRQHIFSLSVGATSIFLSLVGISCSFIPQKPIVQKLEVLLVFVVVTFWACLAAYSTLSPAHSISLDPQEFSIILPNVFFFMWFSFFCAVILIASWYQYDVQKDESLTTIQWILLSSSSFIVMVSAIAYRDRNAQTVEAYLGVEKASLHSQEIAEGTSICEVEKSIECNKIYFAIILGAVSACSSTMVAFCRHSPRLCQSEVAFIFLVSWLCGVIFLTFDEIAVKMGTFQ
jgi:hypothetical protein